MVKGDKLGKFLHSTVIYIDNGLSKFKNNEADFNAKCGFIKQKACILFFLK